jgi:hypothetical protein
MGTRGPVPKRSEQRRRTNKPAVDVTRIAGAAVAVPELGFDVHPLVADWYRSLELGPEGQFYSPAMWQRARIVASMLSKVLESGRPSSQMYVALQQDMKSLLVDAGELRRLGIEVQAADDEADAKVIDYRARVTARA